MEMEKKNEKKKQMASEEDEGDRGNGGGSCDPSPKKRRQGGYERVAAVCFSFFAAFTFPRLADGRRTERWPIDSPTR
jgi:hypothetical protein